MKDDDIKALAAEFSRAREGNPARPGSTRKRIEYPPECIQNAVQLFKLSGQRPSVFASRLGVSASALTRWAADQKSSAFIPVRPVSGLERRQQQAIAATTPARVPVSAPAAGVVVRETVISFPADFDLSRVREIMAAMRGSGTC